MDFFCPLRPEGGGKGLRSWRKLIFEASLSFLRAPLFQTQNVCRNWCRKFNQMQTNRPTKIYQYVHTQCPTKQCKCVMNIQNIVCYRFIIPYVFLSTCTMHRGRDLWNGLYETEIKTKITAMWVWKTFIMLEFHSWNICIQTFILFFGFSIMILLRTSYPSSTITSLHDVIKDDGICYEVLLCPS